MEMLFALVKMVSIRPGTIQFMIAATSKERNTMNEVGADDWRKATLKAGFNSSLIL